MSARVLHLLRSLLLVALAATITTLYVKAETRDEHVIQINPWIFTERVVVIDPGHGGRDPGVTVGDLKEKDIVLDISLRLRELLCAAGATVVMTREDDRDLSKEGNLEYGTKKRRDMINRCQIINSAGADLFVSIHANAFPSARWYGAQVFYESSSAEGAKLARFIQDELRRQTDTKRNASDQVNHFLLKHSNIPSVTVEVGFLSNPKEASLLASEEYRQKLAWVIFCGLARYLNST
ncbi:MAG: N-acetylmuramoyl-L-alanine amidase CwlD [Bacillota bacterium]